MKKNINTYLSYYLLILFFFSVFFLYVKHNVGNDSTISEWLINYSGGFTKRGLIGQICVYISNFFGINLRDSILIFQISIVLIYFITLYSFFKNLHTNKLMLLSIFTPIFILYPVAEIEVLARKEIFVFCIFLLYLNLGNNYLKILYKLSMLPLAVLIWEPVLFFFPFWLADDIINKKINKLDINFFKVLTSFLPSVFIAIFIIFNPINSENHSVMETYLKVNFNEACYMSCQALKTKSSIYDQFSGNFHKYSIDVFLRYFLIIIIGFGPLIILNRFSKINIQNLLLFKNFDNLLAPKLIILMPVIFLFAMGYDWGRWVNISYVFSILFFFNLYKKKLIDINNSFLEEKTFKLFKNKKIFTIFVVIFCFGWNPKTVISGDVASFPGYRVPYKVFKTINQKYLNTDKPDIKN